MDIAIIEFACFKDDKPKLYLMDDEQYDRWIIAEPQEGYAKFKVILNKEVELTEEFIEKIKKLYANQDDK